MKPVLGITMGDAAGIGAEIIVKSLADKHLYEIAQPIVKGVYYLLFSLYRENKTLCRKEKILLLRLKYVQQREGNILTAFFFVKTFLFALSFQSLV
ncbi:hypothetical protein [Gallibacterium anatis]|uniref:hypothetical protein n=1 Tax=Gallibacterium anatis TaxID=750 RepID=UPI000BDC2FA1|nr:hypothetical protein [Gallibacterium anatis]OZN50156.1 hypothetical protein CF595_00120 [Gallibacterium anatis]